MSDISDERSSGITPHFDEGDGEFALFCEPASFSRVRSLLISELGLTVPADGIRTILILDVSTKAQTSWVRDRIALVGCAVIGFILIFAMLIAVTLTVQLFWNWLGRV